MQKIITIKENSDFQMVYKKGKYVPSKTMVLYIFTNGDSSESDSVKTLNKNIRFGVSVSKKVGKSVIRNRFKRIVRECYKNCISSNMNNLRICGGTDMVFMIRQNKYCLNDIPSYWNIMDEMLFLFKKAGLLKVGARFARPRLS